MRPGWKKRKLNDVISFERGLTYAKGDEVAFSSVGVLRSNNVDLITQSLNLDEIKYLRDDFEVPDKKKVKKSSLLMCMSNGSKDHLGKVALIDRELNYAFGGFMGLLTPNEAMIVPKYLYFVLSSKSFKDYIHNLADGANINNLKYKDLAAFGILLPSLPDQQRIVDILDQEFSKIDALKANAEKSLKAAKDLFQATLKKELEPKEGWKTMTMGEVSLIARGGSPRPIKAFITEDEDGINWIKIGDAEVGGKFIYTTREKIRREGMRSSRYVEAGDFLLSNSMSFGRPYILKTDGCIHDGWLVIKKYEKTFTQDFLYYLLLSPSIVRQFEEGARGSTVRNLNTDIVSAVKVSFPTTKDEQESIVRRVEDLNFKCKTLQQNYQKTLALCDDLKQALLRKAFNGEL